ncbi:MAG: peptide-methionine (S)-S-oxide reductase MsrA [Bdellovibrionales bacterium]|nr:peptide-methionine (S)-S-oxide reductase MsrA [Bdellovibrionales bacterium]
MSFIESKDFETKTSGTGCEVAVFGAGCFWGVEEIFRQLPGVANTVVGYMGGEPNTAIYSQVKTGSTGHAECVRVEFVPSEITYETLLQYFFRLHDPTTINRQGNDVGSQYRSVIFYYDDRQRTAAEWVKEQVNDSKKWPRPVVTSIEPAQEFYLAEEEHQDYLQKYPNGYSCHFLRD